jgi:hypothetical protein
MTPRTFGLSELGEVPLDPAHEGALAALASASRGSPAWCARMRSEGRDLFALSQIAARMNLVALDLRVGLKAIVRLAVQVPCLPPGARDLVVVGEADLVLSYPEDVLRGPLPGYALVQIAAPRHVMHPNVAQVDEGAQPLCLGARIPRGFPVREAVLASYAALTLQAITLDEADPAGVMNPDAVRFWRERSDRIPLSREPFLGAVGGPVGGEA